ncbi:unnamed protein product [Didymodactylos carnosus]|uniref:Uncharacterized protein n=1 Tax=Didymodactylos carnosus TaxID=1234261 RepID=A0A813WZ26_9BILA|nr:unnamed protein product [Didymodactylos carnosus]CAF3650335.1 unnamed protein product [Didymodactylos carnosus]
MASTQPSSSQCEIHGLENLEEYYLVWCDKLANNVVKENIEQKLRTIINYLKIFDNIEICEKYIRENIKNLKVILIVSDQFGQIIVPRLQDLSQLMAVYVYCEEKQSSEQWTQQFQKNTPSPVHFIPVGKVYIQVLFFNIQVKGVLTQIDELIESIKHDQKHREKYDETISISIFDPSNKEKSTTGLNSSFMYQQLLTDILIQMESTSADKKELVDACQFFYKDNGEQLKILNDFDQTYSSNQALWWYPRESFLYRLLNKALRIANIDLLFGLIYLGWRIQQNMLLSVVHQLKKIDMGKYFLKLNEKDVCYSYANLGTSYRRKHMTKEALDCYDKVLKMWKASLGHDHPNVAIIYNYVGQCYKDEKNYSLALTNYKKGLEIEKAKLPQNSPHIAESYECMGELYRCIKKYDLALLYHENALKIRLVTLSPTHQQIAQSYMRIGLVYEDKLDFNKAIEFLQKASNIYSQNSLAQSHSDVVDVNNAIQRINLKQTSYEFKLKMFIYRLSSNMSLLVSLSIPVVSKSNSLNGM